MSAQPPEGRRLPPPSRTAAVIFVTALIATVVIVGYLRPDPSVGRPADGNLLTAPSPVAPFSVTTLGGEEISSSAWAGKIVVVNFWATWCAPCVREMPALSALQERMAPEIVVIGLLQDTVTTEQARLFAGGLRISYPIARSSSEIERAFPPVERLPMTYVLDRSSRLAAMYLGELDLAALEADIRRLLARSD